MPFEPYTPSLELDTSIVYGTRHNKELRLWNKPKSQGGHNADGYEPFPKMVYKAQKVNGKNMVVQIAPPREAFPNDDGWRRACEMADQFTRSCQRIVGNAQELEAAFREGYREGPLEAVAFLNGLDDDVAVAAAVRAASDRKMSEKAQAEAAKADAASYEHLPEIAEQPKRRGRPRKSV